ncbi:putative WD-40 repeat protein [Neospora caninum Liverpool]|uniref:Putative WD-40 repeat protein n=1 Tax=Neospora caninum (strain Liverpool) TaxID=572307 RepID=F0VKW6_NEOCL|nr:putative WD-40 repeat protein [Neospora caninum Liverpool]CBZ54717.1 putative WD-40 repeat protein [Neospora caninum Liverpool]CEL69433.1 TPA: WD-40 repeat protein, putative [Neospora caninum Liverpool]|eukprot:XP_003884747.1 putative WD-40 repeat protein [Neospora caninum Liverpool]
MAELSTTWQPRLLLQSFCSNAATVSSLSLSTPPPSVAEREARGEVLFSLCGGSLFAVALDAAVRSSSADKTNGAEERARDPGVHTPEEAGPLTAPAFLRNPFAAPQRLIDEEVEEGLAAFAAADLSFSSSPPPLHASSSARREGLLVTAGASTGLVRCFRVYVQPRQGTPEEEDETADASRGLQLLRAMQQRTGEGKENAVASPVLLNGENGSGSWLKMEELVKWKSPSAVTRLIVVSAPFAPPFLLSRARKAVCRCVAMGCADGTVECALFLFFQGEKKENEEGEEDGRPAQLQVVQRCFVDRLSGEAVSSMKFHSSRLLLAVGGERGSLRLIDLCPSVLASLCAVAGRPEAHSSRRSSVYTLADHMSAINSLAFVDADAAAKKHTAGDASERRPRATPVAHLVSAGGDKLINFWNLDRLPESAGDLEATAVELGGRKGDGKRKELSKKAHMTADDELTPAFQFPTSELITAMVYVHPRMEEGESVDRKTQFRDKKEERGVLIVGGEQGTLFVLSLQLRKFIRSLPLPTRSAAAVAASLAGSSAPSPASSQRQLEDFNAVVRSLTLLSRDGTVHVLAAQESGAIALLPLALFFSAHSLPSPALRKQALASSAFFIGRMDGILGTKFLPQPPACDCPCCRARRDTLSLGEARIGRGKRKREDALEEDEDSPLAPSFPRSLVALVGERQPWVLRLDGPAGEGHPVGWTAESTEESADDQKGEFPGSRLTEAHEAPAACCDVSRKGCWVLSGASDGSIAVWHVATGNCLARVPPGHHGGAINAVAFQQKEWLRPSPLFKKGAPVDVAADSSRKDKRGDSSGSAVCSCDCRGINSSTPHSLLFAAASSGDHAVKVWKAEISPAFLSQTRGKRRETDGASAKRKDADNAKCSAPQLLVTSLASVVAHRKEINDVKISPNDSLLCTVSQDKTGKLFAFPSLVYIGELRGHTRSIFACAFPKREKIVATASADSTVKLWNVDTCACIKTFQSTVGGGILALSFLSRDTQLVTGTSEGLLQLWNCRTAECIWCLDVCGPAMVTGGSGGQLCLWEDITKLARRKAELAQQRETQQLAALKLLAAEGRGDEVFSLLLRLRRKAGMREFLETQSGKVLLEAFQRGLDLQRQIVLHAGRPLALSGSDRDVSTSTFGRFTSFLESLEEEREARGAGAGEGETHSARAKKRKNGGVKREESEAGNGKKRDGTPLRSAWLCGLDGELSLLDLLRNMKKKDVETLLEFAADWNTNSHSAWLAQGLVNLLLEVRGADILGDAAKGRQRDFDVQNVISSFCAYTERHDRRLTALIEKTFLLDLLQGCEAVGESDSRRERERREKTQNLTPEDATTFTRLCLYGEENEQTEMPRSERKTKAVAAEEGASQGVVEEEDEEEEEEDEGEEEEEGEGGDGEETEEEDEAEGEEDGDSEEEESESQEEAEEEEDE